MFFVTPLVVSVTLTFVYVTPIKVAVCPLGHVSTEDGGGDGGA